MGSEASSPDFASPTARKAVILGASGAVGTEVIRALLRQGTGRSQVRIVPFGQVTALVRRPFGIPDIPPERLVNQIVDVFDPAAYEPFLAGHDAAFCTLGIGQPSKVTREELYRVDVAAAAAFASACRRQGVPHFSLLTAVGSDPGSRFHYLKYKGEVEQRVRAEGFYRASFFRPSMIMTPANRYGLTQAITLIAYPWLDPFLLGPLRKYRSIKVEDLGKAMAVNAERPGSGVEILDWSGFRAVLAGS